MGTYICQSTHIFRPDASRPVLNNIDRYLSTLMTLTPTSEYVGKGYTYYYSVDRRTVFHGCQLEYLLANPQIYFRISCLIACSYRYIYSYDHVYIYIHINICVFTYSYTCIFLFIYICIHSKNCIYLEIRTLLNAVLNQVHNVHVHISVYICINVCLNTGRLRRRCACCLLTTGPAHL